ncbi:hypothetical protein F9278_44595 [Streptomyces phaeolivaceus]|uniref:FAD-binding domain-containing protein n=1 Tax=Streptomyces phaeolivaceus TaxID=2653200 RepID=A0A5P8KFM7_9ACTN|nr:hypothetical protein [Streptomyces phaeolivaceus]QFR02076.1 hypothetical protein F9278_44595 [Streptomyces phaeolivaceus]
MDVTVVDAADVDVADVDVAVVGLGPVGATAANLAHGLGVRQVTLTTKEFGRLICERDEDTAAKRDTDPLAELAAAAGTIRQSLIPDSGRASWHRRARRPAVTSSPSRG